MLRVKLRAIPPRGGIPRGNQGRGVARTPQKRCYRTICPDPDRERSREAFTELLREKAAHLQALWEEAQESGCNISKDWAVWANRLIEQWR